MFHFPLVLPLEQVHPNPKNKTQAFAMSNEDPARKDLLPPMKFL